MSEKKLYGGWLPGDTAPKDGSWMQAAYLIDDQWQYATIRYELRATIGAYRGMSMSTMQYAHPEYWQPITPPYEIEPELKPCPWPGCGGEAMYKRDIFTQPGVPFRHWIECKKCESRGPVCKTEQAARAAWNKQGGE